jgi:spermidine synthase
MLHPDVEKVVICEIEPLIPQVVAEFFKEENYNVLRDPRVEVIYDDARHYILTTREKFDVITSDPIHPWVKGAATLYTREYFEMCLKHLNPGGLVTQWVPLYESDVDTVRSEIATFFEVFPQGSIWANCVGGEGYDSVLLGQVGTRVVDVDEFAERLQRPDHGAVAWSLEEVDFHGCMGLLATYAGRAVDLKSWLEGAPINRDRNLRLQYVAGLGLNSNLSKWIYMQIQLCRTFPDDFFTGSDQHKQALRGLLESQPLDP